jgi:hypothetical protein
MYMQLHVIFVIFLETALCIKGQFHSVFVSVLL